MTTIEEAHTKPFEPFWDTSKGTRPLTEKD